jgi:uncharacterized protein
MIAVAELLKKDRLPGNYFASDVYVQGDFELGLLENRQGNRLIALPDTLLQALYSSLEDEVGASAGLVMFQCGHWWGKYFYRRFAEEISTHYGKPLADMEMVEFLQCLKQCWKTYGWGNLNLDFNHYAQGFIVATVQNSAFAEVRKREEKAAERPTCYAEAGLLSTFFSQLTGQELHCVQTACEAMGAPQNTFILGLAERLKVAEACVEEQQDHDTIMMRLGLSQTEAFETTVSESPESLMPEAPIEAAPAAFAEENFLAEMSETSLEMAEPAATEEPSLESVAALEMLADLPDLDSLDVSEDLSVESSDTAASTESEESEQPEPSMIEEMVAEEIVSAPEMMAEPQEGESALSLDSLAALDNLAGLADLDDLDGLDELENLGE